MLIKLSRGVEVGLGLFFLAGALAKALNMEAFAVQISLYGVVKDPGLVQMAAYATVLLETCLGAFLLGGLRPRAVVYGLSAGLTAVFTGLIFYAWQFKGLEDCGCFGEYLKMSPGPSMVKNFVLLAVLGFGWFGGRGPSGEGPPQIQKLARLRAAAGVLAAVPVVIVMMVSGGPGSQDAASTLVVSKAEKDRPFQKFQFDADGTHYDLGTGSYLVAMLNATCEHCRESVDTLNEYVLASDLPELVSLMAGTPDELLDFQSLVQPLFPTILIPPLDFFEFIDTAPPRLIYVVDGAEVRAWEWKDETPRPEMIALAIGGSE